MITIIQDPKVVIFMKFNIYIRNDEAHQSYLMIFSLLPDAHGFYSHDSLSLFVQQHL